MKLVIISDTHQYLGNISSKLPEADVLVHCGDALSSGSLGEFNMFAKHVGYLKNKYKHILYTPGNHDKCVESSPTLCKEILKSEAANAELLIDEEFIIDGVKFYMSPYTKEFCNWSFPYYNEAEAQRIWNKIPVDVDILGIHQPPYGMRDEVDALYGTKTDYHIGCKELLTRITDSLNPLVVAYGHLHSDKNFGYTLFNGTLFANVAICDERYVPKRNPLVLEIDKPNRKVEVTTLKVD